MKIIYTYYFSFQLQKLNCVRIHMKWKIRGEILGVKPLSYDGDREEKRMGNVLPCWGHKIASLELQTLKCPSEHEFILK